MAFKMHAAAVEQFGKPLVFREFEIPAPGPGRDDGKLALAKALGADLAAHAAHEGAVEAVKKGTSGGGQQGVW